MPPDNDALGKLERLVAELTAIERWDAEDWRHSRPEGEKLPASSRREEA
jgi:hypothetical protein